MSQPQPNKRIMVIDDEVDIRDTLCELLKLEGYGVVGASNGREALELLHTGQKPNVIVLDLMMPVMNGWQFRAQQANDPELSNIPVIVVSAAGSTLQRLVPLEEPTAFLRKPIDLDSFLDAIARCCDGQGNANGKSQSSAVTSR